MLEREALPAGGKDKGTRGAARGACLQGGANKRARRRDTGQGVKASRGEAVVDPPVERGAASGTGGGRGLVSLSPAVRRCHTMAGRVARVKISLPAPTPLLPSSRGLGSLLQERRFFQIFAPEGNIMSPKSGRKIQQHVCQAHHHAASRAARLARALDRTCVCVHVPVPATRSGCTG